MFVFLVVVVVVFYTKEGFPHCALVTPRSTAKGCTIKTVSLEILTVKHVVTHAEIKLISVK